LGLFLKILYVSLYSECQSVLMMTNRIYNFITVMGLCIVSGNAQSALSPGALGARDLDTMLSFIRAHQKVADSLKLIDMVSYTVVFGSDCKVQFVREKPCIWEFSRPGPQPNIKFDSSTCPLDYDSQAQE